MNINELLKGHELPSLPLRAWLARTNFPGGGVGELAWRLEDCWVSPEKRPSLTTAKLRAFELTDGCPCLAIVANATAPEWNWADDEELTDEYLRTLVYLLSPAEPTVWQAIDSWQRDRSGFMQVLSEGGLHGSQLHHKSEYYDGARASEGSELDSDLLAGELLKLMKDGRLEQVLIAKLGITRPMHVAIVETPKLCKSMTPLSQEELAEAEAYIAHKRWAASIED